MKVFSPYRIAAALLVVFCVMHTAGGMFSEPSFGAEADAVFASMKAVHFDFNGSDSTWHGFWFGFGLTSSVFMLFSALVAWKLDSVPRESWPAVAAIAWALVAAQAANAVLSWAYFFAGPGVFATAITLLVAVGAFRKGRAAAAAAPGAVAAA
ncbi:MAG TPA: hypothetical protein VGD74_12610 [Vulgatibacter sp.]